jgi:NAD(P)H-hydrate epimerase
MPIARPSLPPPLPGCTPLFDAAAMREGDRRAAEDHAMPSILLMERAGLAAAAEIRARHPQRRAALVLAGSGNNGGDGYVVARHLAEAGWEVEVAAPDPGAPGAGDAAAMRAVAATLGLRPRPVDVGALAAETRLVVDALLGTGARGAPRGAAAAAVAALADAAGPIVSLDVPSGVEADTGRAPGPAVRAELTVTFHGDMLGLRVEPGRALAGEVVVVDIGIPSAIALAPVGWLAGAGAAAAVPPKAGAGDKYAAGAVLVIGGSPGLTGAPIMAARATMRAGAGLAVAAVPAAVQPVVAGQLVEVMSAPLPDGDGALGAEAVEAALAQARRVGAVALGPGIGRAAATTAFVHALLERLDLPVVLDADGLWHLAGEPERLRDRRAPTVLTPHAGEAARLLGWERAEVESRRLDAARTLAQRSGAVVVLKGAGTISCAATGPVIVNGTSTPALASAGTGDVLTGVIAAFLAKGLGPLAAAGAGAAVHGRAGRLAGRGDGTVAGDVIEALPLAIAER